MGGNSCD